VTERLYFTDSLLADFEATVVACAPAGDAFEVVLDRTAFYPTSGGQPFDTGMLNNARVVDVRDDDEGTIHHRVIGASDRGASDIGPFAIGERVQGRVEWQRRLDHMQQHTGQHVLSAAFDRLFGVRTTSFHLGAEVATIDLAREVTPREIAQAEAEANRVVWDARPVVVRFVTEAEAAALPLRKEPVKTGTLRLVEVTGFDLSACGGTHVPQTGLIGGIGVSAWERFKGATRLTFVCGGRLLTSHARLRDVVLSATRTLSVGAQELSGSIERLQAEQKSSVREIRRLQEELAISRAATLRASAVTKGSYRVVFLHEPSADAVALKTLAAAIVSEPGFAAVLAGGGQPSPVVVARSSDVKVDAGAWIKRAAAQLGGRGGGRPELAQGGLDASAEQVLALARETLTD
jgi:alanyl-tRNA synthetase